MENNTLKILAIDDNQDNLTSVKALIKEPFPHALVLTATEAGKGIELAQAANPDVILLDVVMPDIDGFEACQQLKANPLTRSIPVVFLTALKGDKEARIRALEVGAEAFLSKPIDEVELTAQIRAMQKIKASSTREHAEKEDLNELVAARTRELALAHMAALNLLEDLRRENEARLESETHLRLLFENLPSGVVVHAADTAVRFANPEALRLLGLTLEQMQGKCATDPVWCFLREDGGALPLEDYPVNRLRTSGKPFAGQIIGIRLPGQAESNWVQCSAYPQLDASGQLSQVIVAFTDITARMHAEEALKESEARFRGYVEHAPYGVFVTDAQGRYVDVNPAAERISGYSATQLTSMSIPDLLTAESRETVQSEFQTLVATGRLATELGFRHADGSLRYWSVSATRLGPDRYMAYVEDITERREREAHMALLVRMLDEAPAAITIHDTSGRFLFSNRQNILLHGCASEEEFMSVNLHGLDTPVSKALQAERFQQITEQGAARFEVTHRRRNGSTFPLDVTARAIEWRGQQAVLSIALDITERKQAEAERAQMQAQLIQSQKLESIGTLASGVAHEINNPIMGIMGYAQLLFDHLGPDSPVSEYALEIGKETERIALIAKNLLGFARQENETHLSPARLCDIIASTLSLITSVMRHDQIALEVNVPADLPRITCRSQQIQQVVMNLLTNARDAVNQKYPKPDANKIIRLSAALGRRNAKGVDCVRLTVEDHGVGISEDLRTRIFDPFFTTKPRDKGTGLGLSISYGIVTEHGGELSIESEFGHWTRVHMDLPLNVEAELGLEKEEHE